MVDSIIWYPDILWQSSLRASEYWLLCHRLQDCPDRSYRWSSRWLTRSCHLTLVCVGRSPYLERGSERVRRHSHRGLRLRGWGRWVCAWDLDYRLQITDGRLGSRYIFLYIIHFWFHETREHLSDFFYLFEECMIFCDEAEIICEYDLCLELWARSASNREELVLFFQCISRISLCDVTRYRYGSTLHLIYETIEFFFRKASCYFVDFLYEFSSLLPYDEIFVGLFHDFVSEFCSLISKIYSL